MARRVLSELEGVVLGIVWKFGPCTPHAIRSHLLASRSARFSGSAGAIYPLVVRLEARGLVRSRRDARSLQARRLYTTTAAGTRRLREWLGPRVRDEDVGAVHDPLRVRVYFLAALPAGARRRFLDAAHAGLRRTLAHMQADLAAYRRDESRLSAIAMQGAIDLTRAQLRWLARSRSALLRA